jgi:hypothetical protein
MYLRMLLLCSGAGTRKIRDNLIGAEAGAIAHTQASFQ